MAPKRIITGKKNLNETGFDDAREDIEDWPTLDGHPSTSSTEQFTIPVASVSRFKHTRPTIKSTCDSSNHKSETKIPIDDNPDGDLQDNEDESSEESFLDSLEEERTPLLHDEENAASGNIGQRARRVHYAGTSDQVGTSGDEDHMAKQILRQLPDDKWKAGIAGLLLFIAGLSNDVVLSFVHNRLPYDDPPLPDVVFEHIPYWPWALTISEYLMVTLVAILLTVSIFHRHRWILLRRIATIASLLYFGRCVTLFVTQVPRADKNYYCSPRLAPENQTAWNIFIRGLRVLSGLGLQVNGKWTLCGDYIYSGHTVVHVTSYLFIKEYSPRRWYVLHYTAMILAAIGVFCLLSSRGHYTVDVVIAYWITTRIFWEYHTLANIPMLRTGQNGRNHLTKPIWFPLFRFMESGVLRAVPRKYSIPFRLRLFETNR